MFTLHKRWQQAKNTTMKTKQLVRFLNNSAHMDVDLELVDIIQCAIKDGRLKTGDSEFIFDYVDTKHSSLASRTNSDHSRMLAANHLKTMIRGAYIKSIYEYATVYFQEILKAATDKGLDADKLIGEHSINFSSRDIIKFGSFEKLVEKISSSIFRQLENEKGTKALIEKMDKKLGLGIGDEIIYAALPYLEIRHLLVHGQGKADKDFCDRFPFVNAEEGKTIKLEHELVNQARTTITTLIKAFDRKIVEKGLVKDDQLQP